MVSDSIWDRSVAKEMEQLDADASKIKKIAGHCRADSQLFCIISSRRKEFIFVILRGCIKVLDKIVSTQGSA